MNFPDGLFAREWVLGAWPPLIAACIYSARRVPWRLLAEPTRSNVCLGTVVILALFWSLKAGVRPGLDLHLLGVGAFVLIAGPHLAFLGLCVVLAAVTLNGAAGWSAYALNALEMAAVPVTMAQGALRAAERWLPPHLFVYLFVAAFLGAALSMLAAGATSFLLLAGAGAYPVDYLLREYLPYLGLMAFAEAWTVGVTMTLLVVYRPAWVASFDDRRYLSNK